jgi:tetratricopeptide (TPR) repeat protein/transcriptional regulator with XRE-family HTH domain
MDASHDTARPGSTGEREPCRLSGPDGAIRSRRVAVGLTQEQLAQMSGLSVRAISDIERGVTQPRRGSAALLGAVLGLTIPEQRAMPADVGTDSGSAVPRQLPPAVGAFIGRARELDTLNAILDRGERAPAGTVVISAICGTAGVGKTALAVQWAHQVVGRFPDGQLYINLRGFDPADAPLTPEHALRAFLEALQVAPDKMPAAPQAQAGLYRTLLAGKKMLIVLDNARDETQVRPLLAPDRSCLVVVTSRNPLTGLAAADGAQPVSLGPLDTAEARELLAHHLGRGRVAAEPDAAAELMALCARLPLALAIVAARAAVYPGRPLAAVAAELHDRRGRFAALDAGEPATSMRAVFSWSCQGLHPATVRIFRLLGLHPGPDVSITAAASLADVRAERAREFMHELVRVGLLGEPVPDRFAFHDLLRAYAAEQAHARIGGQQRHSALTRLLDYYIATASAAMDAAFPADRHQRPRPTTLAPHSPPLPTAAAGRDWLDAERANLIALISHAAAGWPGHAIRLAAILFRYLDTSGHLPDAQAASVDALAAARATGDLAAQAESLKNLGYTDLRRGDYERAADRLRSALTLYQEVGDGCGQARTLSTLGVVSWMRGSLPAAVSHFQQALTILKEAGERFDQSRTLNNLGQVLKFQGHYEQAADRHREALTISREIGNRRSEANALNNLGMLLCQQRRYRQAEDCIGQALAIYRDLGSPVGEAAALDNFGHVHCLQARYEEAAGCHRQALATFREMGDLSNEALALIGLGEVFSGVGELVKARDRYHDALVIARQIGAQHTQARAHDCLACTYHATGDRAQARDHWQRALALYACLGVPDAADVSAKLLICD